MSNFSHYQKPAVNQLSRLTDTISAQRNNTRAKSAILELHDFNLRFACFVRIKRGKRI